MGTTVATNTSSFNLFGVEVPVVDSQFIISWESMREIDDRIDEIPSNLPLRLEGRLKFSIHQLIADAWFKPMTVDQFINRYERINTHINNMM